MRITDRYQSSTIERAAPAKPASAATKAAAATTAGSDASNVLDVQVSDKAQALSARAAGIDELKQKIQNGTFKVDADAIASKLVGGDE